MEIKRTANAGVLLVLDGVRILLDGVCQEVPPYMATTDRERAWLLDNPPDILAFTHDHPDHYDRSFVAQYFQRAAGPLMGPAESPFGSQPRRLGAVKITPVQSRHIGQHEDLDHVSYIIEGSRCVWFTGDASPLQWKDREDLPRPDVLIGPFGYATCGGWDITCKLGPKALVLLHLPTRDNDPHKLWSQVEAAVEKGNGPAVYVPELEQRIRFTD